MRDFGSTQVRWLLVPLVILSLLFGVLPATAQGPDDEDTQTVTVRRNGTLLQSRVLKEAPGEDGQSVRAGSLLVTFRPEATAAQRGNAHNTAGALASETLYLPRVERVHVPQVRLAQALAAYRRDSSVESVEPDRIVRTMLMPNDPNFSQQWGMTRINAPEAWDVTTSAPASRVAVLDCGVYSDTNSTYIAPDGKVGHPDLRDGKVVGNINFTTAANSDDYCNHGTHVAGIAAANTNNGIGVAGVGYDASIVNVKVLGDNGSGSFSWIINGILWSAGCDTNPCGPRRADVINMSLGATGSCTASLQSAIDTAWAQGMVIVAAAGNSGVSGAITPANCNHVIGVAASDQNDAKASFSNYGSGVDVAAPGVNILSTDYVGGYASFSGTSMASPFVAGLAALLWTTPYNTSNQAIVDRIFTQANHSALAGSVNGRIDAYNSAASGAPPPPDTAGPVTSAVAASPNPTSGAASVTLTATVSDSTTGGSAVAAAEYFVDATGADGGGTAMTATDGGFNSVTEGVRATISTSGLSSGDHTLYVHGKDAAGNWGAFTATILSVTPAPASCAAPTILSHSDTNPSRGGTVSFSWSAVSGATRYTVQRQTSTGSWSTRATPTGTSFTGSDADNDPNWRVFVSSGTCRPLPGPATVFDP